MRDIEFVRLPAIAPGEILDHMNDPRVAEHMPLLKGAWDEAAVAGFVRAKEDCWRRDGLGHWAFKVDGAYVGWGGFQKEGEEWDFALVLKPEAFGLGGAITRKAIKFAVADSRITSVMFLLAPTRRSLGGLERLGARPAGEFDYDGETFLKYRLDTV